MFIVVKLVVVVIMQILLVSTITVQLHHNFKKIPSTLEYLLLLFLYLQLIVLYPLVTVRQCQPEYPVASHSSLHPHPQGAAAP